MENSRRFVAIVGKINWTENWKIPATFTEKNTGTGLFMYVCRGTASHNLYLRENL